MSSVDRRRRLIVRHRLAAPPPDDDTPEAAPAAVAGSLVALHSSDPVSVYVSVLARSATATVDTIASALYDTRDLLRVHGMRRTLWVADADTASDIVTASADRLVRAEWRRLSSMLRDAGVPDPDTWIDEACTEIGDHVRHAGPVDTQAVGEALPHLTLGLDVAQGKKYATTIAAHTRILLILGFGGHIVRAAPRGTWIASQYEWVGPRQWAGRELAAGGPGDEPSGERIAAAQARVIERYLRAFGPATIDDVAWWTGWPKGAVAKAMARLEPVEVELDEGSGWLAPDDHVDGSAAEAQVDPDRSVAVLPALDPSTMGWRQRDHYLDSNMTDRLFDRNGNGGPTIWVGGRIVGGWAQRDDGKLIYELLTDVGSEATRAIGDELARLGELLGDTRFKVRFPNPLNTELRS